ncbi:MAG: CBS domain-containing protein [Gammaproteobacteria bacterium]|nr:CBS domain-containing protein [Gammaproteobacteria bacterium]
MPRKITVRDYMAASLVTFTPDMDMQDAIKELVTKKISGAPVVDQHGNLVGVLSERDCMKMALNAAYYEEMGGKVKDFMCTEVRTIHADMSITELADLFFKEPTRRYPVFDDENRLVGQISRRDVLRALQESL